MFTKFNQVLLASGLVLTSLVGFGSPAFAQTSPDTSGQDLTATANPITEITWTAGGGSFTHTFAYGASLPEVSTVVGTVAYKTNVMGAWDITASSAKNGFLEGATNAAVKLPYTLKLGTGSSKTPTTGGVPLLSDTVTNNPVDTSAILYMGVKDDDGTSDPLKVVAQNYVDTVTLTFTSGGVVTP